MKNLRLFALACLISTIFCSCSDSGNEWPPVMGTAEYDGQTVYFISSSFISERPRWDSGLRIGLIGLNNDRYQSGVSDGNYFVHMWFPIVEDQQSTVAIYENTDIAELENLSLQIVDDNRNIIYDKDRENDSSDLSEEIIKITSGTFSVMPVSATNDTHYTISFDLSMSDSKTFKGSATIPQGAFRYGKN